MQHNLELAYIGLEVPGPEPLNAFFRDIVGLAEGDELPGGGWAWRNDDRVHRVLVVPGPANDVAFVGMEAVDGAAFDTLVGRLRSAGFEVTAGTEEDERTRRVKSLVRTVSPWGVAFEIVLGLETARTPFASSLAPAGFLTDGMGLGHAVFATTAFDESHAFLTRGLGMAQSDWLESELAPGVELEVRFYHCNPRHHSIALARAPFDLPQRLHHIMFELNSRDDVGAAFDRVWATDLAIANGLGRHANDGMFSFYVVSPAGFQVEIGHGARLVAELWEENRRYDRISAWGHQPVKRA